MEQNKIRIKAKSDKYEDFIENTLKKALVDLSDDKWAHNNMSNVCQQILQWEVQELELDKNRNKFIIRDIHNIELPKLQILKLNHNRIQSIEAINLLYAPALQSCTLNNNQITSISPLKKSHFPNLSSLRLSYNKVLCPHPLTKIRSPFLFETYLDYMKGYRFCCDLAVVLKMQTNLLQHCEILSEERDNQKKTLNAIEEKNKAVTIKVNENSERERIMRRVQKVREVVRGIYHDMVEMGLMDGTQIVI